MQKRSIIAMSVLVSFATVINIVPYVMCQYNVSDAGGVYVSSFFFSDQYNYIRFMILFLLPMIGYYFILGPSQDERANLNIIMSRVGKLKFFTTKILFIVIMSMIFFFCFFGITAITNWILFRTKLFGSNTYLSMANNMGKYMFLDFQSTASYYRFPNYLIQFPEIASLLYAIYYCLFATATMVFSYGVSLFVKREILNYIIPITILYSANIILQLIKKPYYQIDSLLGQTMGVMNHANLAIILWCFCLFVSGIAIIPIYIKKEEL